MATKKRPLRKFTVLLRYPDYVSDDYPDDTYHAWVKAADAQSAVRVAQLEAVAAQDPGYIESPTDFALVGCWANHNEMLLGPY